MDYSSTCVAAWTKYNSTLKSVAFALKVPNEIFTNIIPNREVNQPKLYLVLSKYAITTFRQFVLI